MITADPPQPDRSPLTGPLKIELFRRIGPEWRDLAVLCEIPVERLRRGYEAYEIWDWLQRRDRLGELPAMLAVIGRRDLVDFLDRHAAFTVSAARTHRPVPLSAEAPVDLLGRVAPRGTLQSMMDAAAGGSGGFAIVEGEAGIGKTTFLRAVAADAVEAGWTLLWAACDQLKRAFPLQPLIEALDVDRPAVDTVAAQAERVFAMVVGAEPAVLVVDDLQWADVATLVTLGRLAGPARTYRRRLLIVGSTRPLPERAELAALRGSARRVTLPPLTAPDVALFVERAVGGPPSPTLLRMAAGAGGNPLYLTELVGALARDQLLAGHNGYVDVRDGAVPPSLPAAIAHRLSFLRPRLRRILDTAALLGDGFPPGELATVTGHRLEDLRPYLTEAIRAGILHDRDGLLTFRHGLLRVALYEQIPPTLRTGAHREAARLLAKSAAPVDRVARQLLPSLDLPGSRETWTAGWLARSGRQLVNRAPQVAISLLRWELDGKTLGAAPHDALVCLLAEAHYRVGDPASAEHVAQQALEQVARADLVVDLLWTLAQSRAMSGRSSETLDLLGRALESPHIGTGYRARLLVLTARVHRSLGNLVEACVAAEAALDDATKANDGWAMGWALGVLSLLHGMRGNAATALPLFDRALTATTDQPTLTDLRLMLLINRAVALGDVDRYGEALKAADQARKLAEDAGNDVRLAQAESVLTELWFDIGNWDEALRLVEGRSRSLADPGVRCCDHGVAALIALHRNDPAAQQHLSEAERFASSLGRRLVGSLVLARALDQEQAGARREALAVMLAGISASATEVAEAISLLPDTVRLALVVGERKHAETIVEQAQAIGASEVLHRRAVSNHCRGLFDRDPARLARAAQQYRRVDRLLPCAQAFEAAATAAADLGQARQYRATALSLYQRLHAGWDIARLSGTRRQAA